MAATAERVATRAGQRGATLLIALLMTVTFTLLALSLLETTDMAVRVLGNGGQLERAERAAASGIEWAAADVLQAGLTPANVTLNLDTGVQVAVRVLPTSSPQIVAIGRCNGVEVTLAADASVTLPTLPYAFASFSGQNRFDDLISVQGSAYLGTPFLPIYIFSTSPVSIAGDLFSVQSLPFPNSLVTHPSGTNILGVPALAVPVVDLAPYLAMTTGAVPVVKYTGNKTLSGTTVTGIVIVTLAAGQSLILQNMTLNGSLIVSTPSDSDTNRPTVAFKQSVTINGGTATTGNLAILAPFVNLVSTSSNNSTIAGVALVKNCVDLKSLQVNGQLVTLGAITSTSNTAGVTRAPGFVPNVPIGVTWPGTPKVRIQWRGRQ